MIVRAFLLALLLCAAACAGAPPQERAPDQGALIQRIRAGAIDPSEYDFGAVKFRTPHGAQNLDRLAVSLTDATDDDCGVRRLRELEAMPWLTLALNSADYDTWSNDAAALRARIGDLEAAAESLAHGEPVAHPRGDVSAAEAFRRRAVVAPDPSVAELFSRAARDQALRSAFQGGTWADGLPPGAAAQWDMLVGSRMAVVDCANAEWLRGQLQTLDWFDKTTFGPIADNAAWLIAQHADRSRSLQRDVLGRLQRLAPQGRTDPSNVAYLADRLATADGQAQLYGTQGTCAPEGGWRAAPIQDEANVDERRRSIGLPPMAAYRAGMAQRGLCPAPR